MIYTMPSSVTLRVPPSPSKAGGRPRRGGRAKVTLIRHASRATFPQQSWRKASQGRLEKKNQSYGYFFSLTRDSPTHFVGNIVFETEQCVKGNTPDMGISIHIVTYVFKRSLNCHLRIISITK